TVCRVNSPWTF
nr:immunoglobulin light chain junction region [Macaca mulatta]